MLFMFLCRNKTGHTIKTQKEHPIHHEEHRIGWTAWRRNWKIAIKTWN